MRQWGSGTSVIASKAPWDVRPLAWKAIRLRGKVVDADDRERLRGRRPDEGSGQCPFERRWKPSSTRWLRVPTEAGRTPCYNQDQISPFFPISQISSGASRGTTGGSPSPARGPSGRSQDGRAVQQVHRHGGHPAIFGPFQERAPRPSLKAPMAGPHQIW